MVSAATEIFVLPDLLYKSAKKSTPLKREPSQPSSAPFPQQNDFPEPNPSCSLKRALPTTVPSQDIATSCPVNRSTGKGTQIMDAKARNTGAIAAAVLSLLFYFAFQYKPRYHFSASEMSQIATRAIAHGRENGGLNTTVASVVSQLHAAHPNHILSNTPWMFNNAGGAMGAMMVLHCSLSEYVIIFGSAVGTEGHTGRFLADDYFTILHGEQWAFAAGKLEKEVYRVGDQHFLPRGTSKQYRMPDSTWALEYARGNILSMIPFGLADSFTSTFDLVTVYQTVSVSLRGIIRELFSKD